MAKFKVQETGTDLSGRAVYTYEVEADSKEEAIQKVADWDSGIKLIDSHVEIDSINNGTYKIKE